MISLDRLIQLAIEEAKKSDCKFKHGCIIFDKNQIKSRGYNSLITFNRKLHPRFQRFPKSGIHAEASAILKAKTDLQRCALVVVRINNQGILLDSRPCNHCMMYISYVGIKKVFYSVKKPREFLHRHIEVVEL